MPGKGLATEKSSYFILRPLCCCELPAFWKYSPVILPEETLVQEDYHSAVCFSADAPPCCLHHFYHRREVVAVVASCPKPFVIIAYQRVNRKGRTFKRQAYDYHSVEKVSRQVYALAERAAHDAHQHRAALRMRTELILHLVPLRLCHAAFLENRMLACFYH